MTEQLLDAATERPLPASAPAPAPAGAPSLGGAAATRTRRPARSGGEHGALPFVERDVVAACHSALHRLTLEPGTPLAVTSALRGEGRTTVAGGVALARRAATGRPGVLLELDVVRPALRSLLRLPAGPGVAELLAGRATLEDCLQQVAPGLAVLPVGAEDADLTQLLAAFPHSGLLERLVADGYDVVADLPPVAPGAAVEVVAGAFAATLLVVRAGSTPLPAVRAAAATLRHPPAVLLNGTASAVPRWLRRTLGV